MTLGDEPALLQIRSLHSRTLAPRLGDEIAAGDVIAVAFAQQIQHFQRAIMRVPAREDAPAAVPVFILLQPRLLTAR